RSAPRCACAARWARRSPGPRAARRARGGSRTRGAKRTFPARTGRYDAGMIVTLVAALLPLALPCETAAPREDPTPAARAGHVLVPGTRVRLAPPAGHEAGRGFLGYQWPESATSLMVLEMP